MYAHPVLLHPFLSSNILQNILPPPLPSHIHSEYFIILPQTHYLHSPKHNTGSLQFTAIHLVIIWSCNGTEKSELGLFFILTAMAGSSWSYDQNFDAWQLTCIYDPVSWVQVIIFCDLLTSRVNNSTTTFMSGALKSFQVERIEWWHHCCQEDAQFFHVPVILSTVMVPIYLFVVAHFWTAGLARAGVFDKSLRCPCGSNRVSNTSCWSSAQCPNLLSYCAPLARSMGKPDPLNSHVTDLTAMICLKPVVWKVISGAKVT